MNAEHAENTRVFQKQLLDQITDGYSAVPRGAANTELDVYSMANASDAGCASDTAETPLEVYCIITDEGGDVARMKQLVLCELDNDPNKFAFVGPCFAHQYSLIVWCLLSGIEEFLLPAFGNVGDNAWKYYTSLASLLHIWRDNASEIYSCWKKEYPQSVQKAGVWRVPPKPISQRWGRKTQLENYILQCDPTQCKQVLQLVLGNRNYYKVALEQELAEAEAKAEAANAEYDKFLTEVAADAGCDDEKALCHN